ncbi:MAG: hypothetical protein GOP50_09270 [Candidatus Heimdallarchaeota archaeon]|nr:hypothetical protein [Candidatus Heimdallarchaeota archaeon]
MSEEFIRCKDCGNLNIVGSTRCVFCNNPFGGEETEPNKDPVPEVSIAPSVDSIPAPDEKKEEVEMSLPKLPDIDVTQQKPKKKEVILTDTTFVEPTLTRKFFMISLYSILVAVVHYLLNLLVSIISVRIENPSVDAFPISADLNQYIAINAVSIILGVPFAIAIGYVIGKIIRKYNSKKSSFIKWFSFAVVIDLIINVGITIGLVFAFNTLNENDVLFLKLIGAAFIFLVVSVITLFIPMISGSFLIFTEIDKIFFPKKYVEF